MLLTKYNFVSIRPFKLIVLLVFIYCSNLLGYQNANDTLLKQQYKSYFEKYKYALEQLDSAQAVLEIRNYLTLAKKSKDTFRMTKGYYYISELFSDQIALKYNDSSIHLTKHNSTPLFPLRSYLKKAEIHFKNGDFKKAFDYYMLAKLEAKAFGDEYYLQISNKNIGIIKGILGEHEDALEILKKSYSYFHKFGLDAHSDYFSTIFALAESYHYNGVLDSATYYNKLGYKNALSINDSIFMTYFTFNEGVNQYSKCNYRASKDSLSKSIHKLELYKDEANLGIAYFYLAKNLSQFNEQNKALQLHKKVVKIFSKTSRKIPEIRESYEILLNHYKQTGNQKKQLFYIEKLLSLNQVLHGNYKYLMKNIIQKYDTPQLISEKEQIIDSLEKDKISSFKIIIVLTLISLILFSLWLYNTHKRKVYKKKFDLLYYNNEEPTTNSLEKVGKPLSKPLEFSEEIIRDILFKLEQFEKNQDFLNYDITTANLAKQFNTNSKYLSKVVNFYKNKNFSSYINDLRIEYTIQRLKSDSLFRKYTMKAIAQEVGFNTTQAFSKSFFKKNGIQPSYFIKHLEKRKASYS